MKEKFYLAGPMSGYPQYNFPLFYKVAADLRRRGYDIVSPAELDDEETAKAALAQQTTKEGETSVAGKTWADFLARDVKLIGDGIDGIIFLPNWQASRGARLEAFVGLLHKPTAAHPKFSYYEYGSDGDLISITRSEVLYEIMEATSDGFQD